MRAEPGIGLTPLRLSTFVDLTARAPPAPTTVPHRPPIGGAQVTEAVRAVTRDAGRGLGLEAPQEGVIARAVQDAGRAAGVPSGTHFVVTIVLDREGHVTDSAIRGDTIGDAAWPDTIEQIRAALSKTPIPLGPDEREKGGRVTVKATVLHVFPSGTTDLVVIVHTLRQVVCVKG